MSLRDALLKAGKIDKKQQKRAESVQRQDEHKKRKRKKKKKPADGPAVALTPEQLAAQAAERRALKIAELVEAGRIMDGGRRRFHFVDRAEEIHFLQVSDVIGFQLESGKAAIVEVPHREGQHFTEHTVVSLDAALKIIDVDRDHIRFLQRSAS